MMSASHELQYCASHIIILLRSTDMQGNTNITKLSGHFAFQGHMGLNAVIFIQQTLNKLDPSSDTT